MGKNTNQLNQSKSYKKIKRGVGKALHQYHMISDGDKIAVGLSGGADSLTLLWTLNERLSRIPIKYEWLSCHLSLESRAEKLTFQTPPP